MKRIVLLLAVLYGVLLLLMAGCGLGDKTGQDDEVLATVDGSTITLAEYKAALEKLKSQLPKGDSLDPEGIKTLKLNLLNQLIEKEILVAETGKLGITVSEAEINDHINKIVGEYPDSETFNSRMKEENIDIPSWKKEIEYQILLDKLVKAVAGSDITVTPEEVAKYYDDHLDLYNSPTRVRALQIMLETR
ncbi:MAG: SurA N-terminal domain-containing protein, partial [Candidatus Dadabacteria bacterium]|nr:SurA N-terminal domain-containing protein [Candidatus Dadabacteria bacterium]